MIFRKKKLPKKTFPKKSSNRNFWINSLNENPGRFLDRICGKFVKGTIEETPGGFSDGVPERGLTEGFFLRTSRRNFLKISIENSRRIIESNSRMIPRKLLLVNRQKELQKETPEKYQKLQDA